MTVEIEYKGEGMYEIKEYSHDEQNFKMIILNKRDMRQLTTLLKKRGEIISSAKNTRNKGNSYTIEEYGGNRFLTLNPDEIKELKQQLKKLGF